MRGMQAEGLYRLKSSPTTRCFLTEKECNCSEKELWHRRLGHPSKKILIDVFRNCNITRLINEETFFCDTCQLGKSHALPFKRFDSNAENPLDLVHTDL